MLPFVFHRSETWSVILKHKRKLRVFNPYPANVENMVSS